MSGIDHYIYIMDQTRIKVAVALAVGQLYQEAEQQVAELRRRFLERRAKMRRRMLRRRALIAYLSSVSKYYAFC